MPAAFNHIGLEVAGKDVDTVAPPNQVTWLFCPMSELSKSK
jgi:hypothetical protein